MDVGDEEVRFRGVGDGNRKPAPGTGRIEDALVVPGAEQSAHFARERSGEQAIEFIKEDELVEVTPLSVRLRKKIQEAGKRLKKEK